MTQSTELLPIVQADRDAAITLYTLWGYHETCEQIAAHECDGDDIVQAFARHRIEHTTPDRNAVLGSQIVREVDLRILALGEGKTSDRKRFAIEELTFIRGRILAALTTPPEPTDPAGVSEILAHVEAYDTPNEADPRRRYTVAQMETAIRLALRTPPVLEVAKEALGEAFSTLTYVFECSDDEQASRAAKEAADKIESALQAIKEGEAR